MDESLLFLLLIVLSVLLSYWGVRIQREGLCRTLQGDAEGAAALPRVFPIRLSASALVVGALGFFLCLALRTEPVSYTHLDVYKRQSKAGISAISYTAAAGSGACGLPPGCSDQTLRFF